MTTPTPRTDEYMKQQLLCVNATSKDWHGVALGMDDFARTLERELADSRQIHENSSGLIAKLRAELTSANKMLAVRQNRTIEKMIAENLEYDVALTQCREQLAAALDRNGNLSVELAAKSAELKAKEVRGE
jgi:hypothetical protein